MTDYFDNYLFTSDATSSICPAWLFGHYTWTCPPPNACATDPSSTKQYCCGTGGGGVCWTASSVCASDDSTFTCSSAGYTWCCLKNKEICTQLAGQINICYSTAHDTLNNISSDALNGTYSSLSSAQPSASSYTFDPLALIAQTQTTSTPPTTSTQTTSTQTTTSTGSTGSSIIPHPSPNPLSGGAIAGIVIGVVAAIAIACIAALVLRRNRRRKQSQHAQTPMSQADHKYTPQQPQEIHGDSRHMPPQEIHGDSRHMAHEFHGDSRYMAQ